MPLPKGVKVVLFDFDQTLIHLGADWEDLRVAVKNVATKYGVPFDEKWVLRGIGQAFKFLMDQGKDQEAAAFKHEAFKLVEDEENRALDHSHAIEKAPDVVAELMRRGYKVGDQVVRHALVGVVDTVPDADEAADTPDNSGESAHQVAESTDN